MTSAATTFYPANKRPTNSYAVNKFENYYNGPLASNIHWPKPCAYKGAILSPVTYYRGQGPDDYALWQDNESADVLTAMRYGGSFQFINGTSAHKLGRYYTHDRIIHFEGEYTNNVGNFSTVIRDCDQFSNLLELSLDVNILPNQAPQFVS